jgi:thiol:disulfide interchange protein DsbD
MAARWPAVVVAVAAGLAAPPLAHAQVEGGADSVEVRAVPAREVVRPGDLVPIAVVLDHADGFHSWPNRPVLPPPYRDLIPIPTTIEVTTLPTGATVSAIQWPPPVSVRVRYTGRPVDLLAYTGETVAYVPVTLAAEQPEGPADIGLAVRYQACDERLCYPPRDVVLTVPVRVAAADAPVDAAVTEPGLFREFALEGFRLPRGVGIPAYLSVFGWSVTFEPAGPIGLGLLLAAAALGGLLLNFTPCVLPLVPIKILGLQSAAARPARLALLGGAMGAGVVAFWLGLGAAIAFITGFDAISSLFQTGWFAPVVGVIVAAAGLAMLGTFSVRLPQGIYRIDPSAESVAGSLGFGVMTAVLSTPCTAPFMAGAAAWAVLQRPSVTLATFTAIGAGMALPYVLLTARPGLLTRLPRTGPGSVLLKQVIGLVMLAVAAFFIGSAVSAALQRQPDPPSRGFWWVVGAFVVVALAWMVYRVPRATTSRPWRLTLQSGAVLGMLGTFVTVPALASHGPIDWVPYTPERFAEARGRGSVIVMDFTAEWCLNCKALEAGVLHTERVVDVLESPGVVPMRVDLTTENLAGQAKLKELGWVGIPLLAVFGPGVGYEAPIRYDSYTARLIEDAVARATSATR